MWRGVSRLSGAVLRSSGGGRHPQRPGSSGSLPVTVIGATSLIFARSIRVKVTVDRNSRATSTPYFTRISIGAMATRSDYLTGEDLAACPSMSPR
jgi:hypothetical protein